MLTFWLCPNTLFLTYLSVQKLQCTNNDLWLCGGYGPDKLLAGCDDSTPPPSVKPQTVFFFVNQNTCINYWTLEIFLFLMAKPG